MKSVNPYLFNMLLDPLTGLGDDDIAIEQYRNFDPNNTDELKKVISEIIIPYSKLISEQKMEKVKLALKYYLTTNKCKFDDVFYSILPPFRAPDDTKAFFILIWEECFPGESYLLENPEDYEVVPIIEEAQEF